MTPRGSIIYHSSPFETHWVQCDLPKCNCLQNDKLFRKPCSIYCCASIAAGQDQSIWTIPTSVQYQLLILQCSIPYICISIQHKHKYIIYISWTHLYKLFTSIFLCFSNVKKSIYVELNCTMLLSNINTEAWTLFNAFM